MSRYKAYAEYKSSGVDNLGPIPCAWEVMQLKRSVLDCVNGIWGSEPENDGNDTIVIRVADFDRPRLSIVDDGFTYRKIEAKEKRSRLLNRGDLLLEKSGGGEKTLVGQVVLFDKDFAAVTSNFVAKMTPHPSFSGSYLNYVFSRFYSSNINYCSIKQNTGIQNLDSASYLSEKFGFPPLPEQEKIAFFLDHETAKIDALIEKQQRLIELLKEKRQAVISHAVTKGLNPNAPMKDSGVEWLGEVPAHWAIKKLGYLANKIGSGKTPKGGSEIYQDEGVLFLRSQNIHSSGLRLNSVDCVYISNSIHEEMAGTKVQAGDVLLNITGGSIGRSCLVPADFSTANVNQHVCILRFPSGAREFLAFLIKSQSIQAQIDACQTGGNREGLNLEQISKMAICLPPIDEQTQIVGYLNTSTRKFDELELTALQTVALLQERRTALISAAVTGKIDVRGWQPAAAQEGGSVEC